MTTQIDPELARDLKKADLRYVHDGTPGIGRRKNGDAFKYVDKDDKTITNKEALERITALAIPPAWENVWISPSPSDYLQATGYDEKQRKQYLYHEDWKKLSSENKFSKIIFFAEVLPEIRKKIRLDMAIDALERNKIIATVIWLLERTMIRIGNDEYAKENNSYGLTTLRNRHVTVKGKNVTFSFRGKSGIQHSVRISHPRIAKIIKECIELPGYEIFQYLDDSGEHHGIDSSDVNEYLQELTGEQITAKDFRTWGGTLLSAVTLNNAGPFTTEQDAKKNISRTVKKVSQHLRNTPSVCRNYYIHPTIIDTYQKNILIPYFKNAYDNYEQEKTNIGREEFATLSLLKKYT